MRKHIPSIALILAVLAGTVGMPSPGQGNGPVPPPAVHIISSDQTGITLELTVAGVNVEPVELVGQRYDALAIPGCVPAEDAGRPALPRQTVLLGIPPGADLRLTAEALEVETLPGIYRIAPAPRWIAQSDEEIQRLEPVYEPDQEVYASTAPYPAEPARLGQPGYIRSQRVVNLELTPVQYHPASGELRLIRRLRARLEFQYPNAAVENLGIARPEEPTFEGILARSLLNYQEARTWRTSPHPPTPFPSPGRVGEVGQAVGERWSPPSPAWKVSVNRTDFYRLTYADLQAAGLAVDTLDPRTFKLYNQGAEVAILVAGEADGRFNSDDYVGFYGQGLNTTYTDTNVYWLTYGGAAGLRLASRSGVPASAPTPTVFTSTVRVEENHQVWFTVPTGDDHWFWQRLCAASPPYSPTNPLSATFTANIGMVAAGPYTATVGIFFYGVTSNAAVNPDHHALIYLNDHFIHEAWWDGKLPYSATVQVPQTYLTDITNTFRVALPADTGTANDCIYVNYFTLQYAQAYRAVDDELAFNQELAGTWLYNITDFSDPDILVFDVTDPTRVVRIAYQPPTSTPVLEISKVESRDPVPAGGVLTYTLTVQNVGSAEATGVVVTDVVPAHTAFHYAAGGGVHQDDEVRWTGLTVGVSESLALQFSVTVENNLPTGTVLTNANYGVYCTEGVSATGAAITTTVTNTPHYEVFLPLLYKDYASALIASQAKLASYTLRFQDTVISPRQYLALPLARARTPLSIVRDSPSNLGSTANQANYVLIAYDDFYTSTLPLGAYWQSQGMTTQVIRISDVYDEFACGVFDPTAIRDFLAYACGHWQPPQLAYVLLVGDGSYDYRNYRGFNPPRQVPPYLVRDPLMGKTGSDNWYACVSGDDYLPDLHIGRLPAADTAEVERMVNKVLGYAQTPPAGDWNQQVLFVADNEDYGGDFDGYSEALVNGYLPPAYTPHKVYYKITHTTPKAATLAITSTVNSGCLLVNYIGHGSTYMWAGEKLLYCYGTRCDFNTMNNGGRLPFVVAMTCLDGYYLEAYPGITCLAEHWLRRDGGGAVAAFSATSLGLAAGHDYMNRALFTAIFTDTLALGPATTASRLYLYSQTGDSYRDLVETYHLFGDPALHLHLP